VKAGVEEGAEMWQPSWASKFAGSNEGCFYPPTLFTHVSPASTLAQEEVFGPVLASMTFRTPGEAVNSPTIPLRARRLDLVAEPRRGLRHGAKGQIRRGVDQLDQPVRRHGRFRRLQGKRLGREGGREGMLEYLVPAWQKKAKALPESAALAAPDAGAGRRGGGLDRTVKLYVGGKQARPDSGYSYPVTGKGGKHLAEVGLGNRKDIRNAVEAARKASGWSGMTGHSRAQVLYFLAENLELRAGEFAERLTEAGASSSAAKRGRCRVAPDHVLRSLGRQV
jgi:aldehyde dehydrogenase (NAD+)